MLQAKHHIHLTYKANSQRKRLLPDVTGQVRKSGEGTSVCGKKIDHNIYTCGSH